MIKSESLGFELVRHSEYITYSVVNIASSILSGSRNKFNVLWNILCLLIFYSTTFSTLNA
jgi:hypothetical protein